MTEDLMLKSNSQIEEINETLLAIEELDQVGDENEIVNMDLGNLAMATYLNDSRRNVADFVRLLNDIDSIGGKSNLPDIFNGSFDSELF
jgi:hypothetical protein